MFLNILVGHCWTIVPVDIFEFQNSSSPDRPAEPAKFWSYGVPRHLQMVLHNLRLGRKNDHRFEKNMLLHICYTLGITSQCGEMRKLLDIFQVQVPSRCLVPWIPWSCRILQISDEFTPSLCHLCPDWFWSWYILNHIDLYRLWRCGFAAHEIAEIPPLLSPVIVLGCGRS